MNTFSLSQAKHGEKEYFDIVIDGKSLSHHFVGRTGSHPSQISPLGWKTSSSEVKRNIVQEFLGNTNDLKSGRTAVLVCENCGDVGCGALAVRISIEGEIVRWQDWARENNLDAPDEIGWPTHPGKLEFSLKEYQSELQKSL